MKPISQNFRISDLYLEFEEELLFFAYSEILKIAYRDIFSADGSYISCISCIVSHVSYLMYRISC